MTKKISIDLVDIMDDLHNNGKKFKKLEEKSKMPSSVDIHMVDYDKFPIDYTVIMKKAFEQAEAYIKETPECGLDFELIKKGYEYLKDAVILPISKKKK